MKPDTHDHTAEVVIPAELLLAYEAASYWVDLPSGRITLKIGGEFDPPHGLEVYSRLAVVTAFNPFSRLLSQVENEVHQADLIEAVEVAGLAWFPAAGDDPIGEWEPEPSLGVLDPSDEQLDGWMERFGQNAVVVADFGRPIMLRLHPRDKRTA
ncbi:DUF3293 domain-containing protein [Brevundimonas sp. TWP2-3-4b1]|uniref:DUF3293 domain-containing protein n=1 Tax=Brevundimonas sp. TWP2-3-4b1 TaxID=2804580 RepID=UPI003CF2242C